MVRKTRGAEAVVAGVAACPSTKAGDQIAVNHDEVTDAAAGDKDVPDGVKVLHTRVVEEEKRAQGIERPAGDDPQQTCDREPLADRSHR